MDSVTTPLIWAQSAGAGASSNPAAMTYLCIRRWCGGLTLSSPRATPDLEGLWVFLVGLGILLLAVLVAQGPGQALRQLVDAAGHFRLMHVAADRLWRSGRLVAAVIMFTVLSWTGGQSLAFLSESPERGRADLLLLHRTRGRVEAALEQAATAALTPLRDLAGLADNLPLLTVALVLVFGASSGAFRTLSPSSDQLNRIGKYDSFPDGRNPSGRATLIWGGARFTHSIESFHARRAAAIYLWGIAWWSRRWSFPS